MDLHFSKMHGAGNDFVLLDARAAQALPDAAQIRAMADRHTGIGFDQLLLVTVATMADCMAGYLIYNADGSASEQCGNGARCIAAWLHRDGVLGLGQQLSLQSPAGRIGVELLSALDVRIEMGVPDFSPRRSGLLDADDNESAHGIDVVGRNTSVRIVSMGNPHAVVEVTSMDDPMLEQTGPALSVHARFTHGCNAGFAEVVDEHHLRLRVHERGAGWTRACGSGACAAAAAMIAAGHCTSPVQVALPGGTLDIEWDGRGQALWMRGPAAFVFEGKWPL